MSGLVGKVGSVLVVGMLLILNQGCSKDWMQSDGKTEAKGPSLSGGSSSGELTGFSRNPECTPAFAIKNLCICGSFSK